MKSKTAVMLISPFVCPVISSKIRLTPCPRWTNHVAPRAEPDHRVLLFVHHARHVSGHAHAVLSDHLHDPIDGRGVGFVGPVDCPGVREDRAAQEHPQIARRRRVAAIDTAVGEAADVLTETYVVTARRVIRQVRAR